MPVMQAPCISGESLFQTGNEGIFSARYPKVAHNSLKVTRNRQLQGCDQCATLLPEAPVLAVRNAPAGAKPLSQVVAEDFVHMGESWPRLVRLQNVRSADKACKLMMPRVELHIPAMEFQAGYWGHEGRPSTFQQPLAGASDLHEGLRGRPLHPRFQGPPKRRQQNQCSGLQGFTDWWSKIEGCTPPCLADVGGGH